MSYFDSLRTGCADLNIEVKFGDRLFDIKACCAVFDQLQLQGLHFLFVFSGSDVTASFYLKSKKTIFKEFMQLEPGNLIHHTLAKLSEPSHAITEEDISAVKQFVMMLFGYTELNHSLVTARILHFKKINSH